MAVLLSLALAEAAVIDYAVFAPIHDGHILQGPSTKAQLIGADGSKIDSNAPGGTVVISSGGKATGKRTTLTISEENKNVSFIFTGDLSVVSSGKIVSPEDPLEVSASEFSLNYAEPSSQFPKIPAQPTGFGSPNRHYTPIHEPNQEGHLGFPQF